MSTPIKAGLIKEVADAIKNISDTLLNVLDKLVSSSDDIDDIETTENGFTGTVKFNGKEGKLSVEKVENRNGYFKVSIKYKNGSVDRLGTMSENELIKFLNEKLGSQRNADESADGDSNANSSKRLQVTLQKVVSSDSIDVRLTAINSNYNVKASMDDLDSLLSDDDFIEQLPEDPISYEIIDEDDVYDVSPIDSVDTSNSIHQMLGSAVLLWSNMKKLMWNSYGLDMQEVQCKIQSYMYSIESDIDMFGMLCVEMYQKAPNPLDVVPDYNHTSAKAGYNKELAYMYLYDEILTYVSVLDMYYVNFPHDVQAELDRMVRCWKREADLIGRSTIDPTKPIK